MKKLLLGLAFAALSGPAFAGAMAPHNTGAYFGGFGAYSLNNDADTELTSTSENAEQENRALGELGLNNIEAMIDDGFRYGAEGGYDFGMFRAGIEVSYGHHDVMASKGFVINFDQGENGRTPPINGHATARAELGLLPIFVTGGVDFPLDKDFTLSLNIGGGPVLAKLLDVTADLTLTQSFGEGETESRSFSAGTFNDSEWTWGAQAGPDIEYNVTKMFSILAGYRFMWVNGPEFSINEIGTIEMDDIMSHNFRIGGRLRI